MAGRARDIRRLAFRHNAKPGLGFEIFRLSALYARADRQLLGHALDVPQRLEFHLVYVGLRGAGSLIVDFRPVPLGARTLTVVAAGRVQQFVPDRAVDAWMLMIRPEFALTGGDALDPLRAARVLSPLWASPALALGPADARALVARADELDAEHARPLDAIQPHLLAAQVRALLLAAERLAGPAHAAPPAVDRFFTILERDHARTRSVAHYARQAGISPRRLGELVVAHTGRSPKQVIDDRVILEQKRLLAHTALSVKELAARTGFAEPTNLVKFFRHHTGQTPLTFRAALDRRNLPSGRAS